MKKILAMILAALIFTASVVCVCASSFRDVPDDAYYAAAAERMANEGILSGFGDGRYYGSLSVTRAQIAALVCKMLGKVNEAESLMGETAFNDIPATSWCTGYVNYAVANGIIVGDGDGNFRPDDEVKFEEVVKVIVCILGLDGDIKIDPADWSKEYIEVANSNGLIKNLLGKKGEAMLRSDIAVICDSAFTLLKQAEETSDNAVVTSTTKKETTKSEEDDDEKPSSTRLTNKDEPEETAAETTTETTVGTTAETTAETTTVVTVATTSATTIPEDVDRLPDIWFD